jgi:hypothetical protein
VRKAYSGEKRQAMREFLTFFLKKKEEILSKIEDIHSLTLHNSSNSGSKQEHSISMSPSPQPGHEGSNNRQSPT